MQPLEKSLRGTLERTVKEARDVAEAAANAALNHLGVMDTAPPSHLDEEERVLRRRLRAHGRQLGDMLNGGKVRTMDRLVEEVAYEHWHRMLFARFLAENNLLMYPDPDAPVAVTLEECEDLAAEEGAANGWELAARFASRMLPQIFRLDSPVFQLVLPPEHQQALERLAAELPVEVFTASDSLGWVYQFWQAKRKDEVNASEVKIGARELPAVTQLFTEPYMVSFLLDNSLGAWWAARRLSEEDLRTAQNEEELRRKASIPGVPLEYLRFVQDENGIWAPAAGTFDKWPENLSELKTLDPCCGSGHFLVAAFLMLVPMRMELEGLSAKDAVDAVLRQNIHGLELDQRCVELAAFALALAAWSYAGTNGYRALPELNLACCGLSISTGEAQWEDIAGSDTNLRLILKELYKEFKDAPILGSLVNPEASINKHSIFGINLNDISPLLTKVLSGDGDDQKKELGIVARGLSKASTLLSSRYSLIFTNPPYLAKGKQSPKLQQFLSSYYKSGDADIATVFIKRFKEFLLQGGTHCSVTPVNWYYIKSYESLRLDLLNESTIHLLAKIGSGATAKASWDVLRALSIVSKVEPRDNYSVKGVEATSTDEDSRSQEVRKNSISLTSKNNIVNSPDAKYTFENFTGISLIEKYAWSFQGPSTADYSFYGKKYWELARINEQWELQHGTFQSTAFYTGLENILLWEKGKGHLSKNPKAAIRGEGAHEKPGIVITQTRKLPATLYLGGFFDNNVAVLASNDPSHLSALWSYCSSNEYYQNVRKLDEKLGVTNATLVLRPLNNCTNIASTYGGNHETVATN